MECTKWKPQILAAILVLGGIAIYGLVQGVTEVVTGCVGGIIALSMKLTEKD